MEVYSERGLTMRFKKLLILSPAFPDEMNKSIEGIFVKEQVECIKDYFEEVSVISPCTIWNKYLLKKHFDNYSWDNVHVYYPIVANLPQPYIPRPLKKTWLEKLARDIRNFIRSEKITFDLIHAHYTWYPGALALELKKGYAAPLVITEHTHVTLRKALQSRDPCFLDTWQRSDAIIRVNKNDLDQFKLFNSNSFYISNGFDEKKVYPQSKTGCREKLGLDRKIKIMFSLGTLSEVKGHKYLIRAMKEIARERNNVLCLIAGSGPLKEKLQKEIDDAHMTDHIKLMGFVTNEQVGLLMNACDIFVLPSLSESFGIVQIEALACGKPVVATRNGGSEEIIISDEYGYLVEPRNGIQLAEKIALALDRKWNADKIRDYASGFSWNKIAEKIISIYENLEKKEENPRD
jgi:glycosyltransferase involved in cell wall biosynthesis